MDIFFKKHAKTLKKVQDAILDNYVMGIVVVGPYAVKFIASIVGYIGVKRFLDYRAAFKQQNAGKLNEKFPA